MADREQIIADVREIYIEVKSHDLAGVAAELAFRMFLALFPFFIFVASLSAFIADKLDMENPTDEIMSLIGDSLPADVSSVLRNELTSVLDSSNAGLVSIGVLAAIAAASSGFNTIMKSMNRIYGIQEGRPFLLRYLISMVLTVLAGSVFVTAFLLFILGQLYGPDLAGKIGLGGVAAQLVYYGRWPAAMIVVMLAVDFLYWVTPNQRGGFLWVTPGGVIFTLGWLAATFLFGLYVSRFGSYNATYGALGAVVILMLWFYMTSLILFVGAEVNAVLSKHVKRGRALQPEAL